MSNIITFKNTDLVLVKGDGILNLVKKNYPQMVT